MKTKTVVALIVAIVLIAAGGVLLVLGLSYSGSTITPPVQAEKTYVVSESFAHIQVDTTVCDVTFVKTDGEFRAVCPGSEKLSYTVTVEEGTLHIRQVDLRQWYDFIGIHHRNQVITVYLPEAQYDALRVETDTGDVTVPDSFTFTSVNILADTGDIDCAAEITENLTAGTSTGEIRVQGSTLGALMLSTNTGDIRVKDVSCTALTCDSDTGEVELDNVLSAGAMQLQTNTGDITVRNCDAESANIRSDTGEVSGNFLTSKWFQASTDTGDVSVPMTRDGGLCYIETNTGDIRFD